MIKLIAKNLLVVALISLVAACYGVPTKRAITSGEPDPSQFIPPADLSTIVFIRPYHFYFYGYPVDVLLNDKKSFSLPNQSYNKVFVSPGLIHVRGQSTFMGPPTRDITVQAHAGEVIYLVWDTTGLLPLGTFEVKWIVTLKDLATIYLHEVVPVAS